MFIRGNGSWRQIAAAIGCLLLVALAGCGGGGGAVAVDPAGPAAQEVATARFHVDVTTGQVSVTPLTTTPASRAIFNGTAVGFESSNLVDEAGDTGRKAARVQIVNERKETIGMNGLRVIFSPFTNVASFSDPRPKVRVETLAGTSVAGNGDGAAGAATFTNPNGVAVGKDGSIFVADYGGHRIRRIYQGMVSTFAGSGIAGGTDGLGAAASFNQPYGIALNPWDGSLIVCDFGGHRIRRIDSAGRVTLVAGTGVAGDDDGYGSSATFRNPSGVAVDKFGNIYIAEAGGHRIRKITGSYDPYSPTSYYVQTIAGDGVAGLANGVGGAARFNSPRGITIDSAGTILYVADYNNHRIRMVTPTGAVTTIAGTGAAGSTDGFGSTATFSSPSGIIGEGSNLYVSDSARHTIRWLHLRQGGSADNPVSWRVQAVAGLGGTSGDADGTGDAARFNTPLLLALDQNRNLYVADYTNRKVRMIRGIAQIINAGLETGSTSKEPVQLWNADGIIPNQILPYIEYPAKYDGGYTDTGIPAGKKSVQQNWVFIIPSGVTAFEFTVTVEANSEVGAPPEAGTGVGSANTHVRTYAGGASTGFQNGVVSQARFNGVLGIAADAQGNLYLADSANNSIRRVGVDGRVSTIAGAFGAGSGSTDGTGDVAKFNVPRGVAVTSDGRTLFVADTNNHTIRYIYLKAPTNYPNSGTDPTNPVNWMVKTIAGLAGNTGKDNGAGGVARFNAPFGIALDSSLNLFVAETTGNRVRQLQFKGGDPSLNTSWQVSLVAGDNAAAAGASGTTDGTGNAARFNAPRQIAVDRVGNLYVADSGNHRVRKITPDDVVTTLAGSTSGYTDAIGAAAKFNVPYGIGVDPAGFVYVADSSNRMVRRISPSGVVTTVAGSTTAGSTDGAGNVAQFNNPRAIAVDAFGNIFVGDGASNEKIRLVQRVISVGTNTIPPSPY
ncbi:MAG: hypothetical protein IT210_19535 [Armatimonadetes bacterium]|nr:hypothetical protein [Armatimonadota bacterium]